MIHKSQKTLIIAGMHRSGTSLTANWLQNAGLFIGFDLLVTYTKQSNPSGKHYEDKDFLAFHKKVLQDNGYAEEGYITDESLELLPKHQQIASNIVNARSTYSQWGWKEPRTTLLLSFWHNILPDNVVLAVYRHPTLVVNSLMKRALEYPHWRKRLLNKVTHFPYQKARARYYQVWNRYNNEIIQFARQYPNKTILLEIDGLLNYGAKLIEYLNDKHGFTLTTVSPETIFIRNQLSRSDEIDDDNEDTSLSKSIQQCNITLKQLSVLRDECLRLFV